MILYAITDEKLTPNISIYTQVEQALQGGAQFLQLRDKNSSYNELLSIACKLKDLCEQYNAKFIVNDNILLAKESSAHGVHLGESDDELKKAKDILGDVIIGASCYGSIDGALNAKDNGATYVAFGAMFKSSTKPHAKLVSCDVIFEAKKIIDLPICAIGGITLDNYALLKEAGADIIAVIGGLWQASNIKKTARLFTQ